MNWKKYPEEKPEKTGYYLVTRFDWLKNLFVNVDYYIADGDNIFTKLDDNYDEYNYEKECGWYDSTTNDDNKLYDVVAWSVTPEPYNPKRKQILFDESDTADKMFEKMGWSKFQEDINLVEYWYYGVDRKIKATIVVNKNTKDVEITPTEKYEDVVTLNKILFDALCKKYKEIKEEEK